MLDPATVRQLKPLVVLVGPTAVGKSQVAIPVAQALGTEVLTADSRQVFRGMDIGTDKPSPAERRGVPHRLIDLVEPDEPFNVGDFRRRALAEIARLHEAGLVPLVVGGTGLYVRALLRGLWAGPSADWALRARLEEEARLGGDEVLHRRLAEVDPESAARLNPRDRTKIIRALEVYQLLGRSLSALHREHGFGERPFPTLLLGLIRERQALYRRIEARVELELAKGLLEETRGLLARGYGRRLGSMTGLGYKQMAGYLDGEYDYDEAVRRLKRDTRHFAKRQLTWFRREPGLTWFSLSDEEPAEQAAGRIVEAVGQFLNDLTGGDTAASAVANAAG